MARRCGAPGVGVVHPLELKLATQSPAAVHMRLETSFTCHVLSERCHHLDCVPSWMIVVTDAHGYFKTSTRTTEH